jgi:riboflavin synthase
MSLKTVIARSAATKQSRSGHAEDFERRFMDRPYGMGVDSTMFTGIISEMGSVIQARTVSSGMQLAIQCAAAESSKVGDSIAVNGACLTVTKLDGNVFHADVTRETLTKTTLGSLRPGDKVNIELPVAAGERFGGHFVLGHVDTVGIVKEKRNEGNSVVMGFSGPREFMKYLVPKGSVAVDGVSLTVTEVSETAFWVSLIPHTLAVTTLGIRSVGDTVNLEADTISKHVYSYVNARGGGVTLDLLKRTGFMED